MWSNVGPDDEDGGNHIAARAIDRDQEIAATKHAHVETRGYHMTR